MVNRNKVDLNGTYRACVALFASRANLLRSWGEARKLGCALVRLVLVPSGAVMLATHALSLLVLIPTEYDM